MVNPPFFFHLSKHSFLIRGIFLLQIYNEVGLSISLKNDFAMSSGMVWRRNKNFGNITIVTEFMLSAIDRGSVDHRSISFFACITAGSKL